jgi:hypothetical protein
MLDEHADRLEGYLRVLRGVQQLGRSGVVVTERLHVVGVQPRDRRHDVVWKRQPERLQRHLVAPHQP